MRKKKIINAALALFTLFSLAACSENQSSKKVSSATSTSDLQNSEEAYQKATSKIQKGELQSALDQLKKVSDTSKTTGKVKELKQNVSYLIDAKKALNADDLSVAGRYLSKLDSVSTPDVLALQISIVQKKYQTLTLADRYYKQVVRYFDNGNYDAAAGSLESLNALSSNVKGVLELQKKAQKYADKIATVQKSSQVNGQASDLTNARSSKIVGSKYAKENGDNISKATNEQVKAVVSAVTDEQIISKFIASTGIPKEQGDQYFVTNDGNNQYTIEIRHTSTSNPAVSNMKGIYKYNSQSNQAQVEDAITGNYQPLQTTTAKK